MTVDWGARLSEPGTEHLIRSKPTQDVFVLGAGFSRAVSEVMPLTDELGARALERLGLADSTMPPGGFEAWLSRLAEPQPYLSRSDNTANLALFQRLSEAIHDVMRDAQTSALTAGLPMWFLRFVRTLHYRRATVIPFDYDLLIEYAISELKIWDFGADFSSGALVEWTDVLRGLPGFPPSAATRYSGTKPPVDTFELLKLHGSLNWYWTPDDYLGMSLKYWYLDPDPSSLRRHLPGHVPFVIPPSSSKADFFRSSVLAEIWRSARGALQDARRAVLVGYSLPIADAVASGMLAESLDSRRTRTVVVNTSPEPVVDAVRRATGIEAESQWSVERFADEYVEESALDLASQITSDAPDTIRTAGVVVGWSSSRIRAAVELLREGRTVVVLVGDETGHTPTASVDGGGPALTIEDITRKIRPGDKLIARLPDGRSSPLIGIDRFRRSSGAATHWQVLAPADPEW